jgi:sulfite dehydrogenase
MADDLRPVRGGPPRPRRRWLSAAESEAAIVLAGLTLALAGGGALVGWVLANKNEGAESPVAAETRGAEPATGDVGEGAAGGGNTGEAATTGESEGSGDSGGNAGAEAAPEGTGEQGVEGGASEELAAGKDVFAQAGCGGCHALQDAGAGGTVGPSLDDSKPDEALVVDRVTNGKGGMPPFKGQLSEEQIQAVAAYVATVTRGG